MYRVLVTDSLEPPAQLENEVLRGVATVECLKCADAPALDQAVTQADALVVYHEVQITSRTIQGLERCQVIVRGGVGYDNVDVAAATARNIPVCNIPDYGVDEVADHAIGMMLALNRGFLRAERRLRFTLQPWDRQAIEPTLRLSEATLGIIGCGRIGSATALRARALKMNLLIYDPYLRPGTEKLFSARRVDLPTLLAASDIITVHSPLTSETRQMINAAALAQMKPTALLVNTARGAVVDTDAVADALRAGRLGGAAIDVLAVEPPDTRSRLIALWQDPSADVNLMITPHTAYYSGSAVEEIRRKGVEEIARVFSGQRPLNCVNPEVLRSG